MLRNDNPASPLLDGSWCIFEVQGGTVGPNDRMVAELLANRGHIFNSQQDGFEVLTLALPHARVDAFGGLVALRELGVTAPLASVPNEGSRWGTAKGYAYRHAWVSAPALHHRSRTLTQRILDHLQRRVPWLSDTTFALPIALDDLSSLDRGTMWGNSLVLATLAGPQLQAAVQSPKENWLRGVRHRAERTLAALKRRPICLKPPWLLLSSLGRLDTYGWMPRLPPSVLTMVPTPSHPDCANIVFWGYGESQALTLCAKDGHRVLAQGGLVAQAWKEALHVVEN